MGGGTILGGENLPRNDKGGGVGPEVGEEEEKCVENDEKRRSVLGAMGHHSDDLRVRGGQDEAQDSDDSESHNLDGLSAPNIDQGHGYEISRN